MNGELDPVVVVQLRDAIAEWSLYAASAGNAARRLQRDTADSVMQAARRVALATDTVQQLHAERARQARIVETLRAAANDTARRVDERLAQLAGVEQAAVQTVAKLVPAAGHDAAGVRAPQRALRRRAEECLRQLQAEHRTLELTRERLSLVVAGLTRAEQRLQVDATVIEELRTTLHQLRGEAYEALAMIEQASVELDVAGQRYDAAQLWSVDTRARTLPPPTGLPLASPGLVPASPTLLSA